MSTNSEMFEGSEVVSGLSFGEKETEIRLDDATAFKIRNAVFGDELCDRVSDKSLVVESSQLSVCKVFAAGATMSEFLPGFCKDVEKIIFRKAVTAKFVRLFFDSAQKVRCVSFRSIIASSIDIVQILEKLPLMIQRITIDLRATETSPDETINALKRGSFLPKFTYVELAFKVCATVKELKSLITIATVLMKVGGKVKIVFDHVNHEVSAYLTGPQFNASDLITFYASATGQEYDQSIKYKQTFYQNADLSVVYK